MKLTIERSVLLSLLTPACAITNRRSPSPFGSCVLLRASQSGVPSLTVESRSSTTSVRAAQTADVSKAGLCAVPAEEFRDRVESMPAGGISLALAGDKLKLTSTTSKRDYQLRTLSAESFPVFPQIPPDHYALSGKSLASVLDAVIYASSDDVSQPAFLGVSIAANDGSLDATASDGKRIARAKAKVETAGQLVTFIPLTAAKVLQEALAGRDESVSVASNDTLVYVRIGGVEMSYQRPAVQLPPYDMVMQFLKAKDGPTLGRRGLIDIIRGVCPDGVAGSVPVVMRAAEGVLHLSHTTVDGDPSTDEIPITSGEWAWTVCAEAKFLLDALGRMAGEHVRLCVWESEMEQPLVLRDETGGVASIARIEVKAANADQKNSERKAA